MRWPWRRDKERLDAARREQVEIKQRGRSREPMLKRAAQFYQEDMVADRFREALGGNP